MRSQITSSPAVSPVIRFTAADFPERTRQAQWWEAFRQHIAGLECESLAKEGYIASSSSVAIALPDLRISVSTSSAVAVRRTRELLSDGNDNLRLIILRRSPAAGTATQFGREITVDPGGAVLLSNAEQNTYALPPSVRLRVLHLRPQVLRPLLHNFDACLARPIARQVEGLRLVSNYVEGLTAEPALNDPDFARLVVAQIYDLAAVILGATREAGEIAKGRGLRVARLRSIKVDITENLANSTLSVDAVAVRQQVSPRYIQMLFEEEGTTFSQYVIGQRLVRAHRILTDPRFADRSISSVAFEIGFGDLSYFNRAFRRCYGGTPSEVRAEAQQARAAVRPSQTHPQA
jgi:AraC-like DNA-binding protein